MGCSRCGGPRTSYQRYCLTCHAAYMREWRKTHPLTPAERKKDIARSYANVYKQRGLIEQKPCQECGSEEKLEMHHEDYDRPIDVEWFCRPCHVALHTGERREKPKVRRETSVQPSRKPLIRLNNYVSIFHAGR